MNIFSLRDYYSEPLVTDKYNPKTISIRVVFEISSVRKDRDKLILRLNEIK